MKTPIGFSKWLSLNDWYVNHIEGYAVKWTTPTEGIKKPLEELFKDYMESLKP